MNNQNYKTHRKWVRGFHFVTFFGIVALLVGSIRNLLVTEAESLYDAVLFVLTAFILLMVFYYARSFSLKAQDRAIRAEENFRHYLLTGKPLPDELRMRQIIGLRFASDKEFPALAERAIAEGLSENAIKKAIKDWKGDYYRV